MNRQSEQQEFAQVLSELESVLSRAEHNGVNLIFAMDGQRLCHVCEKYQAVVREALKVVRANLQAGPDDNGLSDLPDGAGTAR
ncbi:MAG TPA: hypothetical protein PKD55_20160 [Bellilinea sp.]|nr:hypothetical protein [Bellilinea sp.]